MALFSILQDFSYFKIWSIVCELVYALRREDTLLTVSLSMLILLLSADLSILYPRSVLNN